MYCCKYVNISQGRMVSLIIRKIKSVTISVYCISLFPNQHIFGFSHKSRLKLELSDYRIIFRRTILVWYKQLLILGFCFRNRFHCSSLLIGSRATELQYIDVMEQINLLALVHLFTFQEIELFLLRSFIATCEELINKDRGIRLQQNMK